MVLNTLTDFEKHIYNTFIKVSRSAKNQPYRARKDFTDFNDKDHVYLKKLSNFFNRFKHISVLEFFQAPYELYKDEKYFGLDYYTSLKATRAYTLIVKRTEQLDPDDLKQLRALLISFKFIKEFCTENNITIDSYVNHKTNNIFSFLLHLQEHKINLYSLFEFKDATRNMRISGAEILEFMFGNNFFNRVETLKNKYSFSKKAKILGTHAIKKIKDTLNKA